MSSETDGSGCPELKTGWKQMSLGVIRKGEVRAVEVPVENIGNAELSIYRIDGENISADCPGTIIGPGETSTLILNFEPQRKRKGRYAQTLTIYSNDIVKPEYSLYFTYEIKSHTIFSKDTTPPGKARQ